MGWGTAKPATNWHGTLHLFKPDFRTLWACRTGQLATLRMQGSVQNRESALRSNRICSYLDILQLVETASWDYNRPVCSCCSQSSTNHFSYTTHRRQTFFLMSAPCGCGIRCVMVIVVTGNSIHALEYIFCRTQGEVQDYFQEVIRHSR